MVTVPHFINGKRVTSNGKKLEIYNPAEGKVAGHVVVADANMLNQAVDAAKKAFISWSALSPLRRSRFLFKYKALLEEHLDELAQLITQEHGKTLSDAKGSIQRGIDVVEFACGIVHRLQGSYVENVATEIDSYSLRQPLGVCAGITPFNFPAMIPLWMFPIAIACGNTFIIKPSEKDPSCAVRLAELCVEAGGPAGVLNVVQGDRDVVEGILHHPDIKAVSFVGSTPVAEHIFHTATAQLKRVQAFGGAKNHCIVMPDVDLDQVADTIVGAAYGSAGERCMAISVVLAVGDALADNLIARMQPKIKELKIGPGDQPHIEMGPLVTQQHLEKVKSYVDLGVKEGAKLVIDGRDYQPSQHKHGFYMGGCLFDHVKPGMQIYREEIFGPVLSIVRVPDFDTALQYINEHEYGNGTAIFTGSGEVARNFASRVQVGMVGVNIPIPVPMAYFSFGGWKRSIFADIHMHGAEGVQFYTKLKTVTQRWPKGSFTAGFTIPTMG